MYESFYNSFEFLKTHFSLDKSTENIILATIQEQTKRLDTFENSVNKNFELIEHELHGIKKHLDGKQYMTIAWRSGVLGVIVFLSVGILAIINFVMILMIL